MNLQEHEKEERYAMEAFLQTTLGEENKTDKDYEWRWSVTYEGSGSSYDAVANRYDRVTWEKVETRIFEAKIRMKEYDSYLLERQKFESLHRIQEKHNAIIYYVNFVRGKVIVHNLTKLNRAHKLLWEKREQPRETINPEKGTKIKELCMIPVELGKAFDFDYGKEYQQMRVQEDMNKRKESKYTYDLSKFLFKD